MNDAATTENTTPTTLKLGTKTYTVVKASDQAISLLGARGGEYVLVRNQKNQAAWALIPAGRMNPRAEWFLKNEAGAFVPADAL